MRLRVQLRHQDCSWDTSRNVATRKQHSNLSDLYRVLPVRVAGDRNTDQRILKDQGGLCSRQDLATEQFWYSF